MTNYEEETMFKVAICDDDISYHETIKSIIESNKMTSVKLVYYTYSSGKELLENAWQQYDLVFLDAQISDMNGNETAKCLRQECRNMVLVCCASIQKPTPELFKVQPFRYIMKDRGDRTLREEMPDIMHEMMVRAEDRMLNVTADGKLMRIPIKSILYVSVAKRGAIIHIFPSDRDCHISCKETVKEIYETLNKEGFEYAHNSYIVNMCNIVQLEKGILRLKDMTELNISRSKKKHFEDALEYFIHKSYKRG